MIRKLLFALSGRLPCRLINDGDRPYLERYYLGRMLGYTFYLHRFVGSDPARGLHDHPWDRAWSLILAGKYYEETRTGMREVRWFNRLTGDSFHRVVLPCAHSWPEGPCSEHERMGVSHGMGGEREAWTLFAHGPYVKRWGFLRAIDTVPGEELLLWQAHAYQTDEASGKQRWWDTAPKGRDTLGRVPA